MNKQSLKKLLAFIIVIMVFSLLPQFVAAQNGKGTKCNKIPCPPGYICVNGYCKRYFPFFTDSSSANGPVLISQANSNATSIQPVLAQNENGPKCKDGACPPRYFCMNGVCKKYVFFTDSSSAN
jgi:hypothetical protein